VDPIPVAVAWSRRALRDRDRDRDRIHAYLVAHASAARAYAVIRKIDGRVSWLAGNPDGGMEIEPGRRELIRARVPYVIEYARERDRVRVLYIWHQSQDRQSRGR